MNKFVLFIYSILFSLISIKGLSQGEFILYNLQFPLQRTALNPAFMPLAEDYLGIAALSQTSFNYRSNALTYSNIFSNEDGIRSFNFKEMNDKLKKRNLMQINAQTDLLNVGTRIGQAYLRIAVSEKVFTRFQFNGDLLRLGMEGNSAFLGDTAQIGDFDLKGAHYRSYGIGLSVPIGCWARFGMQLNYLYGMEAIQSERSRAGLYTNLVDWSVSGTSDILIQTAGLQNWNIDSLAESSYLFRRRNRGWSGDFGLTIQLNKKSSIQLSALDLGHIHWKSQSFSYRNATKQFEFSGIDLGNFFLPNEMDSLGKGVERYLDSLGQYFNIQKEVSAFTMIIPHRYFVSYSYALNATSKLHTTLRIEGYGKSYNSGLGFTYNKNFDNVIEISSGVLIQNGNPISIPFGFAANISVTQVFLATDNLPGLFFPLRNRQVGLRLGINVATELGERDKKACDKDNDGIPDRRDDCPDVYGLKQFRGCPDTDGDGIPDRIDGCPLEFGLVSLNGCPDRDGDGIADDFDKCPDIAGLKELNGCPDRDFDGVADIDDECPDEPGNIETKGCPDKDNDGVADIHDECPDKAGLSEHRGCPDTDGDGVFDDVDQCPTQFGLLRFKGCPDTDGDGVEDRFDACPELPGLLRFNGCPWSDIDGDGIPDDKDNCPTKAGPKENRGCPLSDRDGDGIPDKWDACPDQPGYVENNGCPELDSISSELIAAVIERLDFEPGQAKINVESYVPLMDLAAMLLQNQQYKIIISGHTDNVGKASVNLALSKNRALAVERFLVEQGVSKAQIKVEWFGDTLPIADNSTQEGRIKNRRVEFTLLLNR